MSITVDIEVEEEIISEKAEEELKEKLETFIGPAYKWLLNILDVREIWFEFYTKEKPKIPE